MTGLPSAETVLRTFHTKTQATDKLSQTTKPFPMTAPACAGAPLPAHAVLKPASVGKHLAADLCRSAALVFLLKLGTIVPTNICAISSVGRAARLHREGREFKSLIAHHQCLFD